MSAFQDRLSAIVLLILDVDGTLTNGRLYVDESPQYMRCFNVQDGLAIRQMLKTDMQVGIISHSSQQTAIQTRAQALGIELCYVGRGPKEDVLESWCQKQNIPAHKVCVLGDDDNDLGMFDKCGISVCPANATMHVRKQADIVLSRMGGSGCVRELLDGYLLPAKQHPL